ncbi:MAG: YeeE/YedE family protein [Deltaproteobacteria bacterium]|nr:YeeE/YedE family protein [Deltaproteobacteria bacterium]
MTLTPFALPVLVSLLLGVATGFVMHRSSYCLAGAFRDLFLFRSVRLLRALLLLVAATMVLVELARRSGLLPLYPFPGLGAPSLASLAGGVVFGMGMVLAGGCVVGTLYQAGAGHASAWVALAGLVAGSGLYAEIFPWCSAFGQRTALFGGARTVPQWLGVDPGWVMIPAALAAAVLLWRQRRPSLPGSALWGCLAPWKASLLLSLVTAASLVAVGMPLGVTTTYAKAAGALESFVAPGHVASLEYFQTVPFGYVLPWGGVTLAGGPGPGFDGIALLQLPIIAGVLLGGALSAVRLGEFPPRLHLPAAQVVSALAGGLLMAVGSRLASGCNLWHLLGGLPVLALGSLLFTAGIVAGAWIGAGILVAVVLRPTSSAASADVS